MLFTSYLLDNPLKLHIVYTKNQFAQTFRSCLASYTCSVFSKCGTIHESFYYVPPQKAYFQPVYWRAITTNVLRPLKMNLVLRGITENWLCGIVRHSYHKSLAISEVNKNLKAYDIN
uniref:Uncharacterized protein n=1 Tax=Glossina pallidipes TaxID=7398 RepID=A0A1A9Z810_GLOPL